MLDRACPEHRWRNFTELVITPMEFIIQSRVSMANRTIDSGSESAPLRWGFSLTSIPIHRPNMLLSANLSSSRSQDMDRYLIVKWCTQRKIFGRCGKIDCNGPFIMFVNVSYEFSFFACNPLSTSLSTCQYTVISGRAASQGIDD